MPVPLSKRRASATARFPLDYGLHPWECGPRSGPAEPHYTTSGADRGLESFRDFTEVDLSQGGADEL